MDEDNSIEQVAPVVDEAQSQTVVDTESSTDSPEISAEKEEKILGKFNSVDDLAKSYQELEKKFTQVNQTRHQVVEEQAPAQGYDANGLPFDEDTIKGLDTFFEQKYASRREAEEAQRFVTKYADDLKNPFVDARTRDLIRSGIDRVEALNTAKKELDDLTTPRVQQAKVEGLKEGEKLANNKELMGAVGQPGSSDKTDPNNLSAAEFAKFYGFKRV